MITCYMLKLSSCVGTAINHACCSSTAPAGLRTRKEHSHAWAVSALHLIFSFQNTMAQVILHAGFRLTSGIDNNRRRWVNPCSQCETKICV